MSRPIYPDVEPVFAQTHEEPYWTEYLRLRAKLGPAIGSGRHRVVFAAPGTASVIKFPWNDAGEVANMHELEPDGWLGSKDRYAKTWRDHKLSKQTGLLVIRMEFVRPTRGKLPQWAGAVDGEQVGYTRDRRLVAYDWG